MWHDGLLYKHKSFGVRGKFFQLMTDYLESRYQRVVLNGKMSSWLRTKAGVPQGSILGPLLFLIYINDLPDGLNALAKLFADDTSLFTVIDDKIKSSKLLNNDLETISKWAYKWKMLFNPDSKKPAKEIVFSKKINKSKHPPIYYNNIEINQSEQEKHLGLLLDEKLTFKKHLSETIIKACRGIDKIKKLRKVLPRKSLITIYKSFIRPILDYCDIIYDQPEKRFYCYKIEKI